MRRRLLFGLASLVATAIAGSAMADNLVYQGAANTAGAGGYQDSGLTNGPASYSSVGTRGSASASMDLDVPGGRLTVAASADKQARAYGIGQLDYSLHIEAIDGAPTDVPLQIGIEASGYTDASGPGGTAYIELFVGSFFHDYISTSPFDLGAKTYSYSHAPIVVTPNYVVNIRMLAGAYAYGEDGSCSTNCGATAEAWIDPTFTILGPSAGNYRIVGVPGPTATPPSGAVPEPSTWALMIAGFGLAGVVLRRRPSGGKKSVVAIIRGQRCLGPATCLAPMKGIPIRSVLMATAAFGLALGCASAEATTLVIDPTVQAQGVCAIASGACATYTTGSIIVGGVQQGLILTGGLEYALPILPKDAVLTSAMLSIGAYSRYGVTGFQGWQDNAVGGIDLTAYVGNGIFDASDVDHRGAVDVTLARAATTWYDVTGLVSAFQTAGNGFLGFSIYQNPVGVCGYGDRCEVSLTGDTEEFAFTKQPQLIIDYVIAAPPISPAPEPATWALLILGFAGAGAAMRQRSSRAPA